MNERYVKIKNCMDCPDCEKSFTSYHNSPKLDKTTYTCTIGNFIIEERLDSILSIGQDPKGPLIPDNCPNNSGALDIIIAKIVDNNLSIRATEYVSSYNMCPHLSKISIILEKNTPP